VSYALRVTLCGLAMACSFAGSSLAETSTRGSSLDSRIQRVRYNGDIVRIVTAEGVVTAIELDKKEAIKDFAMGDRDAWHAKFSGNLFLLKPKDIKGDTNLTIFTDKRAYLFELVMLRKKNRRVAYWLRVQDPEDLATTPEGLALARRKAEARQITWNLKAVPYQGALNYDYWIVGPRQLQPLAAHDNGQFTYLTFSAAHPLPVAFVLEPDGTESLVDFHMDGDTMVLHRAVEKILLRRGDLVAGITNKLNHRAGQSSPTGTASDKVQRVIKGKEVE